MKTKKIVNKLIISKQTVANLENEEMNSAVGGTRLTNTTVCAVPLSVCVCKYSVTNSCECPMTR